MKLGVRRPARVLVRFVDVAYEGLEEWVPPARLKCLWADVEELRSREQRWDAVTTGGPPTDDPTEAAASTVFELLISPEIASVGYSPTAGVTTIHDVERLARFLELDVTDLHRDPRCFEEEGALIAPWVITQLIASRAASRDPHEVLRHVEREEADARREATYGKWYPARSGQDRHIPAEICAQVDEAHGRPVRAVLRRWCGQEPADLRNEIAELRREAGRVGALAEAALHALREAGRTREAARLEREYAPEQFDPGLASRRRLERARPRR